MTQRVKTGFIARRGQCLFTLKLGMEVGEGGKRVEKKVKRKPTCRDDEIICLIEGIGNKKVF